MHDREAGWYVDRLTKLTGYMILYNKQNKTTFYAIKLFIFNSEEICEYCHNVVVVTLLL